MSNPVRVVFCSPDFPNAVNGPSSWLLRLLPDLRDRDIRPHVLLYSDQPGRGVLGTGLRRAGIPCDEYPWHRYTCDKIRWTLRRLQSLEPDVFVPNCVVPAFFAARWARAAGVPTVGVLHSDDDYHHAVLETFVAAEERRLSAVVAVSKFMERAAQGGRHDARVVRIPYGVPAAERLASAPCPGEAFRIAYVGRLIEEQKRIGLVARAFCAAAAAMPDVELTIYGDGPDRASVERILSEERGGDRVRLAGRVDSAGIQERLAGHHALALLSDYEGLPIALMEAMACGVPPICRLTRSGIEELVEEGVTGLFVDDSVERFVSAVHRLKCDPDLWRRMSGAARDRVATGFTTEVCADRWAAFLAEIAEESAPRGRIELPATIELPPIRPEFAREDFRRASLPVEAYRATRRIAGVVKRKLVGSLERPAD